MTHSWALISGASTGLGRATALQLAAQGFQVLAGVRSESAADALRQAASRISGAGRVLPITLDVAVPDSIRAAAERAAELSGAAGLRVVINNAGIVVPGPLEFVPPEEWRRQFDVNFFGMVELTRATLPLLRKAVAAHGAFVPRLLFVSSIGGRISQPMLSPYTSSKFATTALGDAMRLELLRQGIGVTVAEPGAIATEIWAKGDASAEQFGAANPARALYGPELDGLIAAAKRQAPGAIPAERAARQIVRCILGKRPRARLLVGDQARTMAALQSLLPRGWFDGLVKREFGISGPASRGRGGNLGLRYSN